MPLDFGRSFDDPSRTRVAESSGDGMFFTHYGWAHDLQGKINDFVDQLGAEQLHVGGLGTDVHFLIGLPGAVIGQGSQRGQFGKKMAERSHELFGLLRIMAQRLRHITQDPLRQSVGTNADLKSSRAYPGLIELPTVAYFAEHLRFWYAADLENQLAGFGACNRGDAAHNSISRCSGID